MTPLHPTPDPSESPADARALDALLALDRVPPPSPALRRAILLDFDARAAGGFWRGLWREIGGLRIAAPALTASLVLGIAGASLYEPVSSVPDAPGYAELALFDAPYEDYAP